MYVSVHSRRGIIIVFSPKRFITVLSHDYSSPSTLSFQIHIYIVLIVKPRNLDPHLSARHSMQSTLFTALGLVGVAAAAEPERKVITLSGDTATGLVVGFVLLAMVIFSVKMLSQIQISDTMGDAAKE